MTRKDLPAGAVRIICTDNWHHDSPEFARRGHHWLMTLRLGHGQWDRGEGFTWRGQRPRKTGEWATEPDGGRVLVYTGVPPGLPVKEFPRDGHLWIFKFECSCGRTPQRNEYHLMDLARRLLEADPGAPRIDIDITTID